MPWQFNGRDLAGVLIFALVLAVLSSRAWQLLRPANEPRHPIRTAMCDFQDVVYYPARAAMAGVNPYDSRSPEEGGSYLARFPVGNSFPVYGPLIFACSLPFAALPLVPAEIAYWLVNVGLLLLFAWLLLRITRLPQNLGAISALAAVLVISRPGQANLYFGAIALPMVLATIGSWWLADGRPWLSAVCLAIALIKPTFGGPLLILMLVRGSYRAAIAGLALGTVAAALAMLVFLPQEILNRQLFETLIANQSATERDPAVDPLQSASRIDCLMVVERTAGRRLPGLARLSLSLLVLGIAGWNLRELARAANTGPGAHEHPQLLSISLACLTIAICIYHNIYDGLLTAVPAVWAWRMLNSNNGASERQSIHRSLALPIFICLAVPAVNYFSSKQFWALLSRLHPLFVQLAERGFVWTILSVLNALCLVIAWGLLLVLVRRQIASQRPGLVAS